MSVAGIAIRHPVTVLMATSGILLLGMVSLSRLPIDLWPDVTRPVISVITTYENASPEEVEELITRRIEEGLSAVPGVVDVTSVSTEGRSMVTASFVWGTDMDAAANDVRDRLDRVIPRLPGESDRPILRKQDLASFPVMFLGGSSGLDPVQLHRIIDEQVKYRIERVPGVASLDVWGGLVRQVRVEVLEPRLKALAIPVDQVIARIRAENVNLPAGRLERGSQEVAVRTFGLYASAEELANTVVAIRDGVAVRLRDLARVEDSYARIRQIVRINGQPGIRMGISKQSGSNTVEVARGVLAELERIERDLPQIKVVPIFDSSEYISRSISSIGSSAMTGGMLAIMILLVFLRSVRSTFVIATAIPVSIVASFGLIYLQGLTLNFMTLGGLALGVGMLVDNAIVVLENIYRLHEGGIDAHVAATQGSEEVTAAVTSSTLTTVVVFLPLVFMQGMSGVLFAQFALVVSFALLCSLGSALTVVPVLAERLLARGVTSHRGWAEGARRGFERLELTYRRVLSWSLRHRPTVVIAVVALLAGSLVLVPQVGVELMPLTDEGEVRITAEMDVGTRLDLTGERMLQIESIVREAVPELKSLLAEVGGGGWHGGGSHTISLRLGLVPLAERTRSSDEVAQDLRRRLSQIPGLTVRVRPGSGMVGRMMGAGTGDRLQVEIRGYDLEDAARLAKRVKEIVESTPGVADARISREKGTPEAVVVVDRVKAGDLGFSVSQVASALQTLIGGTMAGTYREEGREYDIVVRLADAEKRSLGELLDLEISSASGRSVPLRSLVTVRPGLGPVRIERRNQERTVTVSAELDSAGEKQRDLGSVAADIQRELDQIPLPPGFSFSITGDWEEQQKSFRELAISLVLALALVYMVMASQYESLRDPFVVMFSVPFAVIGVVVVLVTTGTTLNIQSFIGGIMLGGIVVNNAILLVDHINLLRRRDGMPLREAIEEAGRRRLRPILMTTSTTVLAMLPLALGIGEGAEAQAPMARVVVGGLISSMLVTLVLVPVVYSLFERMRPKDTVEASAHGNDVLNH